MRSRLVLALLILCATTYPAAQEPPYLSNVSFANGSARATLVNPTTVALTAWYVDAIDVGGRPLSSLSSDAIEVATQFVPARGTQVIEIPARPPAVAVVFRAAVDANGHGIGDREIVGRIKEAREWRKKQKPGTPAVVR